MFRLKNIWESVKPTTDEFSPDAFTSFILNDQICIVTGSFSGILRFYFPNKADSGNPVTEISVNEPILQLEYSKVLKNDEPTLIILHPKSVSLHSVLFKDRTVIMEEKHTHTLSHSAYNFIVTQIESLNGPFSIVVQTLDGFITIITPSGVNNYPIPHFFLPGPFTYVPLLESFIFAASDYTVRCYRKNIIYAAYENEPDPDWKFVLGEAAVSIHCCKNKTKTATLSMFEIAIVGERTLVVLTESGKLKTIFRHNGGCISSHSYTSKPEHGKRCNNLIVGCTDKTAAIFVNFRKVWQLALESEPITISTVDVMPNKGLISILSSEGVISVGYLGTHEPKGAGLPKLPVISEDQLKKHIDSVEKRINSYPNTDHLQIFVSISRVSPSSLELVFQPQNGDLTKVNCHLELPLSIEPVAPICIDHLDEQEKTYRIELKPSALPPSITTVILSTNFNVSDDRVFSKSVKFDVPPELFIRRTESRVKGSVSVIVYVNGDFPTLSQCFPNVHLPDKHSFSFILSNGDVISISEDSKNKRYRVEADSFAYIAFPLQMLNKGVSAIKSTLVMKDPIPLDKLAVIVKNHHSLRLKERSLQQQVHSCVVELEHIQKALIARYEAANPQALDDLTALLTNTTTALKSASKQLIDIKKELHIADGHIEAAVATFLLLLRLSFPLNNKQWDIITRCVPHRAQNCLPGWEECAFAGLNCAVEKLTGTKQTATFGGEVEFLSNVDTLMNLFENIVKAATKCTKQ